MTKTIADEELNRAFLVAKRMIEKQQKALDEAVSDGNWTRAAGIKDYISGMEQMLTIFDLAAKDKETL